MVQNEVPFLVWNGQSWSIGRMPYSFLWEFSLGISIGGFLVDALQCLIFFREGFTERWTHGYLIWQTTSKRLADRKVAKFQKNITKRGSVPETSTKKGYDYPVGPILLGFFVFVVVGSCMLFLPCWWVFFSLPFIYSFPLNHSYHYVVKQSFLIKNYDLHLHDISA